MSITREGPLGKLREKGGQAPAKKKHELFSLFLRQGLC